jgi:hypothetical protein
MIHPDTAILIKSRRGVSLRERLALHAIIQDGYKDVKSPAISTAPVAFSVNGRLPPKAALVGAQKAKRRNAASLFTLLS